MMAAVVAEAEQELSVWAGDKKPTLARLRERVAEVLLGRKALRWTKLWGGGGGAGINDGETPPYVAGPLPRSRNRRNQSRRQRKCRAAGTLFTKPEDPRVPTAHLFIANVGPVFGQSADDVRKALEAVAGAHGGAVKSVTVIDPQRPHLHASFESPAVAQRVRKALDPRLSNAPLLLLGRAVKTEYSERSMPVALFALYLHKHSIKLGSRTEKLGSFSLGGCGAHELTVNDRWHRCVHATRNGNRLCHR